MKSIEMKSIEGFDFISLGFDSDGNLNNQPALDELKSRAKSATDVIVIAHGFRNSEADASDLYTEFLKNFRENLKRPELASLNGRNYVVAGVFWPSKSLAEAERDAARNVLAADSPAEIKAAEREAVARQLRDLRETVACEEQKPRIDRAIELLPELDKSKEARDEFVKNVESLLDDVELEEMEGLGKVRSKSGSELLKRLEPPVVLPVSSGPSGGNVSGLSGSLGGGTTGQVQGFTDVVGSVFGAAKRFLNMTTWYVMKDRAGTVGSNGTANVVRQVAAAKSGIRIHLVGHSLGGRLVAACAKALPSQSIASLTLLQAAFSHYGLSTNKQNQPGFFRDILNKQVVRGPIIATHSDRDSTVGLAYALASRLAGDNVKAVGDENDDFGGIGRNGTQRLEAAVKQKLRKAGSTYDFKAGVVTNLNGSGDLIKDHSDIRNEAVTFAFASALART